MIVDGIVGYFKSLAVGGSLVNSFTGWRQKVRLFYADVDIINESRSLELDATIDMTVNLDTELLKTPAENRQVYTSGALLKPKVITINAHMDIAKLEQIKELRDKVIPVWIMCSKNLPGAITQIGYWTPDNNLFAINGISIVDNGYDNTVAVTFTLEEIKLFTYNREYQYDLQTNKVIKKNKSASSITGSGARPVEYKNAVIDPPLKDLNKDYLNPNVTGGVK